MNNLTVIPEELDPITVQLDNIEIISSGSGITLITLTNEEITAGILSSEHLSTIVSSPESVLINASNKIYQFQYYGPLRFNYANYSTNTTNQHEVYKDIRITKSTGEFVIQEITRNTNEYSATSTYSMNGYAVASAISTALSTYHDNTKLDASKSTFITEEPTSAISDGGIHIVYLQAEPATKYDGYIYMIAES